MALNGWRTLKVMSVDQINWCIVAPYLRGKKLTRKSLQDIAKVVYEEEMIKASTLEKLVLSHVDELDISVSNETSRGEGDYDLGNATLALIPLRSLILDRIMVKLYLPEKKHMISWVMDEEEILTRLPMEMLKCQSLTTSSMREDIQVLVTQYMGTTGVYS